MSSAIPVNPLLPSPSERLAQIIEVLCAGVAARGGRQHSLSPLVIVVWSYFKRLSARFDRLVLRVRAGKAARPARTRPASNAAPPTASRPEPKPKLRLPTSLFWLRYLAPQTAPLHGSLRLLLCDPEMVALLEREPQAGRLLRPLCRALGIVPGPDLPAALFARNPRPRPVPEAADLVASPPRAPMLPTPPTSPAGEALPPLSDSLLPDGPVPDGPVSDGPVSDGPVSDGPVSDGPVSNGPLSDGPLSDGPLSDGLDRPPERAPAA